WIGGDPAALSGRELAEQEVSETTFGIPVLTGEVQRTPIRSGAGLRVPEWQAGAGLDRSSRDAAPCPHRTQPVAVIEIRRIVRIGRHVQPTGIQLAAPSSSAPSQPGPSAAASPPPSSPPR